MSSTAKKKTKTPVKKKAAKKSKPRTTKAKVARTRRRKLTGTKKAKTSNRRRRMHAVVSEEYDWATEMPNLKLSRSFVIVLGLHVVVVAGLLGYELIGKKGEARSAAAQAQVVAEERQVETPQALPERPPEATQATPRARQQEEVVAARPVPSPAVSDINSLSTSTYTVKAGDTLFALSRDYSTSVADLVRLNNMGQARGLQIGEILKVPKP